jgi:hypothetical protein
MRAGGHRASNCTTGWGGMWMMGEDVKTTLKRAEKEEGLTSLRSFFVHHTVTALLAADGFACFDFVVTAARYGIIMSVCKQAKMP